MDSSRKEDDTPTKPSVAELARKFKGHTLPNPAGNEWKPPSFLQLREKHDNGDPEKPVIICPHPPKVKLKSSPLIEKLQANLALSPTALLPTPKSPEPKVQAPPFSPISPVNPTQRPGEDEAPVSFEGPAEGTILPSINKGRPRLSFKRRPPTRLRRRSVCEEGGEPDASLDEADGVLQNGNGEEALMETEGGSSPSPTAVPETEKGRAESTETQEPVSSTYDPDADATASGPAAELGPGATEEAMEVQQGEKEPMETNTSWTDEDNADGREGTQPTKEQTENGKDQSRNTED